MKLKIQRSNELDKQIVDKLIQWYEEHRCYDGECLCQDDDSIIDAPNILADILDNYLVKDN